MQNEILTLKQDNERLQRRIDHQSAASSPHHTMDRIRMDGSSSSTPSSSSSTPSTNASSSIASAGAASAAGSRHRSPVDDLTVTTGKLISI